MRSSVNQQRQGDKRNLMPPAFYSPISVQRKRYSIHPCSYSLQKDTNLRYSGQCLIFTRRYARKEESSRASSGCLGRETLFHLWRETCPCGSRYRSRLSLWFHASYGEIFLQKSSNRSRGNSLLHKTILCNENQVMSMLLRGCIRPSNAHHR